MKDQHDNGPNRARPFVRKNSGSLIIHENVPIFRPKMKVKMGLTAIFLSLVHWIDIISHIKIAQNDLQHLTMDLGRD